jgi:hypothetical protein
MDRVHNRLTAEQVEVLLEGYRRGLLGRSAIEAVSGIGRPRFFVL